MPTNCTAPNLLNPGSGWHSVSIPGDCGVSTTQGPPVGTDVSPSLSPRWRGDYGGKKQLWFPSNYVEEISSPNSLEPEREVSWGQAVGSSVCTWCLV